MGRVRRRAARSTLVATHRVDWLYLVPTMMQRIWRLPEAECALATTSRRCAPCCTWRRRARRGSSEAWIDWLGAERDPRALRRHRGAGVHGDRRRRVARAPRLGGPRRCSARCACSTPTASELPPGEVGEVWMRRGADAPASYRYVGAKAQGARGRVGVARRPRPHRRRRLPLPRRPRDRHDPRRRRERVSRRRSRRRSTSIRGRVERGDRPARRGPRQRVHAIVQLDAPASDAELLAHLGERLAPYKLPRTDRARERAAADEAGKVRRSALRAERVSR